MSRKKNLYGSESRSTFLYWHKQLGKELYASDIDMVLVTKTSYLAGGITAIFDHKVYGYNKVEFTEAVLYKFFLDHGVRVFLVETGYRRGLIVHPFQVREILKVVDWFVPSFEMATPIVFKNRVEFEKWERQLRLSSTVDVPR